MPSRRRRLYGAELEAARQRDRDQKRRERARNYAKGLSADGKPLARPDIAEKARMALAHDPPPEYAPMVCRVHL